MTGWNSDTEMLALMRKRLYTPAVGDVMDAMGLCHQFLPPAIRPLDPGMRLAGRVMPVLMTDVYDLPKIPYGLLTEALDQMRKNEVFLATGGSRRCAYWGENLNVAARMRGAAGAVIDGWHRDTPQLQAQNWPVFSHGSHSQDLRVRSQVVDYRCRVEIGAVSIEDGDIVFGDVDGVVVIPNAVAEEVVRKSLEKAAGEKLVRKAIEDGVSLSDAFDRYGII